MEKTGKTILAEGEGPNEKPGKRRSSRYRITSPNDEQREMKVRGRLFVFNSGKSGPPLARLTHNNWGGEWKPRGDWKNPMDRALNFGGRYRRVEKKLQVGKERSRNQRPLAQARGKNLGHARGKFSVVGCKGKRQKEGGKKLNQ